MKPFKVILLASFFIFGFFSFNAFAKSPQKVVLDSAPAFKALQNLFTTYSEGEILKADAIIDQSMIGRQEIVDAMNLTKTKQKQIRISLHDTTTENVGKNVVVIRTGWEKRFIVQSTGQAEVKNGQSLFFMQKMKSDWKLVGQSGENLFAP